MTITLYTNSSENIAVDKTITIVSTLTGNLREECSITDPSVLLDCDLGDIADANYMEISEFGRYYFITGMTSVRDGLVRVDGHVDVLMSFAEQIRDNYGIIRRQEKSSHYNLYINDGSLVSYEDPYILTEPFPKGFGGFTFILTTAGG